MWHGAGIQLLGRLRAGVSVRNASDGKNVTDRILKLVSTMPRERQHGSLKQQAQAHANIAENSSKFSANMVYVQVLGAGNPNSLYLFTDQKRYLFNCGEGTQRLSHEHKVKLSRLEHIFITSKTWRHMGGLPGVSLTLQDVGVPKLTLHGPPGLNELYSATKRFVIMNDMQVAMAQCSPSHDFEDNVMTIKYVLIGREDKIFESDVEKRLKISQQDQKLISEFEDDNIDYYNHEKKASSVRSRSPSPLARKSPDKKNDTSRKTMRLISNAEKKSNCSVSYICTMKKRLGTLDLNKCVERGVKPGPLLGLLKQGKDVVLDDGRLVLSADVKTPDELGPVFIVLDVPDLTHFKESDFKEHFDDGCNPPDKIPALVVHFTPKHIQETDRYEAFSRKFGSTTQHLLLNYDSCSGSLAVHRVQHKLHLLDPDIFPLLNDTIPTTQWVQPDNSSQSDVLKNKIALAQFESIIKGSNHSDTKSHTKEQITEIDDNHPMAVAPVLDFQEAKTLSIFHLRPKRELDRSAELRLNIQEYILETMDTEGFPASLERFRRLAEARRGPSGGSSAPSRPYPRVLFLGTGSCIPNKTRNTSAILLHIDEKRSVLMDCGEGTYGQLVRFYGAKHVKSVLASIRAIYISHLHADHHIGLIGVLQGRRKALNELKKLHQLDSQLDSPLYLLAPGQIMTWLSMYDQQFEKIRAEFQIIPNQALLPNAEPNIASSVTPAMLSSIGLRSVKTCQVQHCPNSFGVCLEAESGERITYSGDTMPCDELVNLGENSTLLIHEATMEDELASEARAKKHSTTSQAIDLARRMKAKYTILTHFSQRYARLPRLNQQIMSNNNNVGIAFDNMQVTMDDLDVLPHMYAPLQLMFADHCTELEQKAAKRAQKRNLYRSRSPSPLPKIQSKMENLGASSQVTKQSSRPQSPNETSREDAKGSKETNG